MGIVRCFLAMVDCLRQGQVTLNTSPLDKLISSYDNYAYVGNRRELKQEVLALSSSLCSRISRMGGLNTQPPYPSSSDPSEWAAWWYGREEWATNSGVFPDFVLACIGEPAGYYWMGALLELKDSESSSIASFNSTLPSSVKDMRKLSAIVRESVCRFDLPLSQSPDYLWERKCFYLVRTRAKNVEDVRVSFVEGTFFETLPNSDLLRQLWKNLLQNAGISEEKISEVIESLATLERDKIAISRHIERASIKPRLRIMSEVESEGNPHTYSQIPARTANLIVKPAVPDTGNDTEWLSQSVNWFSQQAKAEGLTVKKVTTQHITFTFMQRQISLDVCTIHHRRNGRHLVLQAKL